MDSLRRSWPHVRTGLILLHIVAVLALSLPHPSIVVDKSRWASGRGQMELARWTKSFNEWGWSMTKEELEENAWALGKAYEGWYRRWVHPFELYQKYLHVRQGWSMFTHPKKRVGKVWIEVEIAGHFWPVFVTKSPVFRWRGDVMTHNRMRKLFNRVTSHRYKGGFDEFAHWVAPQLARDYPDSKSCRVSVENYVTPGPAEYRAGKTNPSQFQRRKILDLERLR